MTDTEILNGIIAMLAKSGHNCDRESVTMRVQLILEDAKEMQDRVDLVGAAVDMTLMPCVIKRALAEMPA